MNEQAASSSAPNSQTSAAEGGVIYTCPMHPEVRQRGPGSCPKCGMTLEPLAVRSRGGSRTVA